jgi:hypothetical protein
MFNLNTLLDLPRSCVYAIVDEKHQRVLIQYSTSLMGSLARLIEKIKLGDPPCRKLMGISDLKFVVLEEIECRNRLMVRTGFYMREYKSLGYELLVEKLPIEYVLKCVPKPINSDNAIWVLQAFLVSKRNSKILVGEFKSQASYDEFKALNYSIEPINDIVYHESVSE